MDKVEWMGPLHNNQWPKRCKVKVLPVNLICRLWKRIFKFPRDLIISLMPRLILICLLLMAPAPEEPTRQRILRTPCLTSITIKSLNYVRVCTIQHFKFNFSIFRWNSHGLIRIKWERPSLLISRSVRKRSSLTLKSSRSIRCRWSIGQQERLTYSSITFSQHGYVLLKTRLAWRMLSLFRNYAWPSWNRVRQYEKLKFRHENFQNQAWS